MFGEFEDMNEFGTKKIILLFMYILPAKEHTKLNIFIAENQKHIYQILYKYYSGGLKSMNTA